LAARPGAARPTGAGGPRHCRGAVRPGGAGAAGRRVSALGRGAAQPQRCEAGPMNPGTLVISLDFELYWGVRDLGPLAGYRDNLLGVRQAVPALLRLFDEFQIHVTWATVGFLFFDNKRELEQALPPPELRPRYVNAALSPYEHLARIGADETEDPYHF